MNKSPDSAASNNDDRAMHPPPTAIARRGVDRSGRLQSQQRARVAMPPAIELNIAELGLHGFSARERSRITSALQDELRRLLAERSADGSLRGEMRLKEIDTRSLRIRRGMRPEAIASALAQAIVEQLSR